MVFLVYTMEQTTMAKEKERHTLLEEENIL
jgi:hypothetical protein